MFVNDFNEKVFQTLPGQGWRVLIQWERGVGEISEGYPEFTEEPVIAWVTAKVQCETTDPKTQNKREYENVVITPLVRYPDGRELMLLGGDDAYYRWVYLSPGEERTPEHFDLLCRKRDFPVGVSRD